MITFYQGNSVDFDVFVTNADNTPYNITNDKVWFTIKNKFTDADLAALIQVTTLNGITILDPTNGELLISLSPDLTKTLPTNVNLHCDVQIRTQAGKVYTVLLDQILVMDKVTQTLNY